MSNFESINDITQEECDRTICAKCSYGLHPDTVDMNNCSIIKLEILLHGLNVVDFNTEEI